MLQKKLRNYYKFLAREVYKRNGRDFWKYHRNQLESVGLSLSKPRLIAAAMSFAVGLALNPKWIAEQAVHRLRRMHSGSAH